jgi:hypothetical protein
MRCCW